MFLCCRARGTDIRRSSIMTRCTSLVDSMELRSRTCFSIDLKVLYIYLLTSRYFLFLFLVECGFLSEGECKATTGGESCVWNSLLSACLENSSICHSNSAPPNCQRLRGCSDCLANVQCHWCESEGLCLERNSSDSAANSCNRKVSTYRYEVACTYSI